MLESHKKSSYGNSDFLRPLAHGQRDTVVSDETIVALVIALFFHRGPLAVARRISQVVILALDCMLWGWFFSHVTQEVFKLTPRLANRDSATAVVFIRRF